MQFLDIEPARKNIGIHLPFLKQRLKIWRFIGVVLSTVSIATTEITVILTVGDVNIQAYSGCFVAVVKTFDHCLFPLLLSHAIGAP